MEKEEEGEATAKAVVLDARSNLVAAIDRSMFLFGLPARVRVGLFKVSLSLSL